MRKHQSRESTTSLSDERDATFSALLFKHNPDYQCDMISRAFQHVVAFAVILSIVAPMSSAALARLGMIDSRVMVICTGDELRLVVIGHDGQPVELSEDAEHCALVHAAFAGVPDRATVPALRRLAGLEPREAESLATPREPHLPSLPRAPPVV